MEMVKTTQTYHFEKPGLFPTIHFSYKLPADQQTMLSYTRRINRPNPWQLEPFKTWTDAYNTRIGNPNLVPEYINSIDFGYQKKIGANFIALDAYYRITENKIERVQSKDSILNNSGFVILNSFENVGTDYSLGAELTFNYSPYKWYQVNLMGDLYKYREKGTLNGEDFSQHSFNWTIRMNNIFRIGSSTRFQFDMNYNSRTVTAQGTEEGFFTASVAAKQDFFKRKLTATLQLRDILGNVKRESTSQGIDFYNHNLFKPDSPQVMLTISYKINNYKVKREKQNGEGEDSEGGE
jgi:outer membrane receptor protein involved in Fe transport